MYQRGRFSEGSKAILDRADRRQSNFADKITGFRNGSIGKACAGRIKQGIGKYGLFVRL
jgi:hypothetical protein